MELESKEDARYQRELKGGHQIIYREKNKDQGGRYRVQQVRHES